MGHVVIESRGSREDGRDRSTILDCFRDRTAPAFDYDWRTKAEPLLWYPDALAGIVREQITQGRSTGFSFLQGTRTVTDVRYVR